MPAGSASARPVPAAPQLNLPKAAVPAQAPGGHGLTAGSKRLRSITVDHGRSQPSRANRSAPGRGPAPKPPRPRGRPKSATVLRTPRRARASPGLPRPGVPCRLAAQISLSWSSRYSVFSSSTRAAAAAAFRRASGATRAPTCQSSQAPGCCDPCSASRT